MVHYYQAIDKEVEVAILIQNHARGSVFSIDTMVRLINEVEHVEYVKEETFPVTHMITELVDQSGPKLKGDLVARVDVIYCSNIRVVWLDRCLDVT